MESKSENKWYSLILFVVQFLVLMFYLEIFECNFCHLNKNTKKNVQNRAQSEELIEDKTSSRSSVKIFFILLNVFWGVNIRE